MTRLDSIQEDFVQSPATPATAALPPGLPVHPLTGNLRELGADRLGAVSLAPAPDRRIEMEPSVTLRPKHGLKMAMLAR